MRNILKASLSCFVVGLLSIFAVFGVQISGPSHSNVTSTTATISFTTDVTADGELFYGTNSNSLANRLFNGSSTSHSFNISSLQPGTTYYYKAVATALSGSDVVTIESSVNSFDTIPVVQPEPAPVISETLTQTTYHIVTDLQTTGSLTINGNTYTFGTLSTTHDGTINGLSCGNSYPYSIAVVSQAGVSNSKSGTFATNSCGGGGGSSTYATPDQFTFTDVTGANLNTAYESNTIKITGINTTVLATVSGGMISINSGAYVTGGNIVLGDTVKVKVTSANSYNSTVNSIVTIGGVSDTYSVATSLGDTTPDQFTFTDVLNAELNTGYESNIVTITGINTVVSATVSGGMISINSGSYVTSGNINNGDTIKIKATSPNAYSTTLNVLLTVGTTSDTYSITTKANSNQGGSSTGNTIVSGGGGSYYYTAKDFNIDVTKLTKQNKQKLSLAIKKLKVYTNKVLKQIKRYRVLGVDQFKISRFKYTYVEFIKNYLGYVVGQKSYTDAKTSLVEFLKVYNEIQTSLKNKSK